MESINLRPMLHWMLKLIKDYLLIVTAAFHSRIISIAAFFATLFYLEIALIMFNLVLTMGKTIAVLSGFGLAGLLTVHIIYLNAGNNKNRIIQLILMDIHAAIVLSFILDLLFFNTEINAILLPTFIVRCCMLAMEIPLIYFLSDEKVKKYYKK